MVAGAHVAVALPAHGQVLFHLAVAGVGLRNPLRGLLLFSGSHGARKINRVVRHVHIDIVIAQRRLILEGVLYLALKIARCRGCGSHGTGLAGGRGSRSLGRGSSRPSRSSSSPGLAGCGGIAAY